MTNNDHDDEDFEELPIKLSSYVLFTKMRLSFHSEDSIE